LAIPIVVVLVFTALQSSGVAMEKVSD
jgi:hypothetical protein